MASFTMDSPIGLLTIHEQDGAVTSLLFGDTAPSAPTTPLLQEAHRQICAYFDGTLRRFSLPLHPQGTVFQRIVWDALCDIPYGETRSYGQLAAAIGRPAAVRAVGGANHRNPIPILIPCHRVIGSDGSLTGYAAGLPIKQYLLTLEQALP